MESSGGRGAAGDEATQTAESEVLKACSPPDGAATEAPPAAPEQPAGAEDDSAPSDEASRVDEDEERISGMKDQTGRKRKEDPDAAAEAEFVESLDALLHIAADASAAQCIALLEAVTGGIAGFACSVDTDRPVVNTVPVGSRRLAQLAADAKVIVFLTTLMHKHASDARVQAAGCDLLAHVVFLLQWKELLKAEIAAAAEAVLAAACAHTAHLAAHFRACQAIIVLSNYKGRGHLPYRVDHARQLDACNAICAARIIHSASMPVQILSLQVLGKLCPIVGIHDGALRTALASLRARDSSMAAACLTLTGLAESCDHDGELLELCQVSASVLIATMRRCLKKSSRLQARGSMTLAKLADSEDTAALISSMSGIEAVVDALRTYGAENRKGHWEQVEESAWYALLVMTRFNDKQAQRAIDAGALSLPPASSEEAVGERTELFERLQALQQRKTDAVAAKQLAYDIFVRRQAHAAAAERQRKADAEAVEAAKQRADAAAAKAAAAAAAERQAAMQRAALAADAAMEALLAEEEAERAAAGSKRAGKPKRKKAARAAPAPAPEAVPDAASDDAAGGGGDTGAAQPSASAARRLRRAAAKAASREPVVPAADATSPTPPAVDGSASLADAPQDSTSDDDAPETAVAELSDALQSVHIAQPAAVAHVGAADAAHLAALQAALHAAQANLAEHEARTACKICLDAPCCVLLLPCRHVPLCSSPECAAMLGAPPLCPLCRTRVADTMQLFM